jgi:hypothetical protein
MRDHLPTGTVVRIMTQIGEADPTARFEYSNPYLESMADEYAKRILNG